MRKKIGYKNGYKITISDGFYEVIDGRVVTHFGQCNKTATVQEIANNTILKEDANANHRGKRFGEVIRKEVSRGSMRRSEADEGKNVVGLWKWESDRD